MNMPQSSSGGAHVLLRSLESRFDTRGERHKGMAWSKVLATLESVPSSLEVLHRMEDSGGEPDVIGRDKATGQMGRSGITQRQASEGCCAFERRQAT
jgi:uncharacterized protein DUF4256